MWLILRGKPDSECPLLDEDSTFDAYYLTITVQCNKNNL